MDYQSIDFNEWRHFDDRTSNDRSVGSARATETQGRCANCWGPAAGRKNRDGHWIRIECQLCGRSVEGEDAEREAERMQVEAVDNMTSARVGRGSRYGEEARFVLKILPNTGTRHSSSNASRPAGRQDRSSVGWDGAIFRKGRLGTCTPRRAPSCPGSTTSLARCLRSHSRTLTSENRGFSVSRHRAPIRRFEYLQ